LTVAANEAQEDPNDARTWSVKHLKETLNDLGIPTVGFPEKQDMVNVVMANWDKVKRKVTGTHQDINTWIDNTVKEAKDDFGNVQEITSEKATAFANKLGKEIRKMQDEAGLSDAEIRAAIDSLGVQLANLKYGGIKNLQTAIDKVKEAYDETVAKKDALVDKAASRIEDDINKSKAVSQDTIKWLKDEIYILSNEATSTKHHTFARTRAILRDIRNKLKERKGAAADQVATAMDNLEATMTGAYTSIANMIASIRESLEEARSNKAEDLHQVVANIEERLTAAKEIGNEQVKKVAAVINDRLADVKYAKDLTEDKITSAMDAVQQFFEGYYNATTEKATDAAQMAAHGAGEAWKAASDAAQAGYEKMAGSRGDEL
jgi:hypothetical protein